MVEVGGCNRNCGAGEFNGRLTLKSAVAISKKQADIFFASVGHNQIGVAVAVEVAAGDSVRGVPHGIIARRGEAAVGLAEENGNGFTDPVRDRGIRHAVTVEIVEDDVSRPGIGGKTTRRTQSSTFRFAKEGDDAASGIGDE